MANPVNSGAAGDELLVAHLDGELTEGERRGLEARLRADPALKARFDALAAVGRRYEEAFAPLLEAAPRERLNAMLDAAAGGRGARTGRRLAWVSGVAAAAVFAAGLAIGVIANRLVAPPAPMVVAEAPPPVGWRQVVAEYLVLITADTLTTAPQNPALDQALAAFGGKLMLDLGSDKVALADAVLKDAQIYDYRGRPLVRLTYLADDAMPLAFCIILSSQPDAPLAFEQREGQNIVFWTRAGHAYMVVGKAPRAELESLAESLAARFS
jgi:anti-sigma factor RsiW